MDSAVGFHQGHEYIPGLRPSESGNTMQPGLGCASTSPPLCAVHLPGDPSRSKPATERRRWPLARVRVPSTSAAQARWEKGGRALPNRDAGGRLDGGKHRAFTSARRQSCVLSSVSAATDPPIQTRRSTPPLREGLSAEAKRAFGHLWASRAHRQDEEIFVLVWIVKLPLVSLLSQHGVQ